MNKISFLSALWANTLAIPLLLGLAWYHTNGNISASGGGSTQFLFIPLILAFISLITLHFQKSPFHFSAGIAYWLILFIFFIGQSILLKGAENWVFTLAFCYVVTGVLFLLHLLVFQILHFYKKKSSCVK